MYGRYSFSSDRFRSTDQLVNDAWCLLPLALPSELRWSMVDSVVKLEAHLSIDFSRIVIVEAAEGEAVVEQDSPVRHIEDVQRDGRTLSNRLACGKVQGDVLRQVVSRV